MQIVRADRAIVEFLDADKCFPLKIVKHRESLEIFLSDHLTVERFQVRSFPRLVLRSRAHGSFELLALRHQLTAAATPLPDSACPTAFRVLRPRFFDTLIIVKPAPVVK